MYLWQLHTDSGFEGHAGAILQARQLGDELYVGVHSDEAILENKGPSVMTMQERYWRRFPLSIHHAPAHVKFVLTVHCPVITAE